jgi:hypothetical protein
LRPGRILVLVFTQDVGLADMNDDGKPDVITLSSGPNVENAYISTNQSEAGTISMGSTAAFANGGQAFIMTMALADFDADGKADLGYANHNGNTVFWPKMAVHPVRQGWPLFNGWKLQRSSEAYYLTIWMATRSQIWWCLKIRAATR